MVSGNVVAAHPSILLQTTPDDRPPMPALTKHNPNQSAIGCGYLLVICAVTGFLLAVNVYLVGGFFHVNREWLLGAFPDREVQFRITQAAQIIFPVAMTMLQFWIFDRFVDRAYGYGTKKQVD